MGRLSVPSGLSYPPLPLSLLQLRDKQLEWQGSGADCLGAEAAGFDFETAGGRTGACSDTADTDDEFVVL